MEGVTNKVGGDQPHIYNKGEKVLKQEEKTILYLLILCMKLTFIFLFYNILLFTKPLSNYLIFFIFCKNLYTLLVTTN